MAILPMERAAAEALRMCDDFRAEGHLEAVELVEIDCVAAVKKLLRHGSPRLRHALIQAALAQTTSLERA